METRKEVIVPCVSPSFLLESSTTYFSRNNSLSILYWREKTHIWFRIIIWALWTKVFMNNIWRKQIWWTVVWGEPIKCSKKLFSLSLTADLYLFFFFTRLLFDDMNLDLLVIRFIIFNTNTSQTQFINKGKYTVEMPCWKSKVTFPVNTKQNSNLCIDLTVRCKIGLN